MIQQGIDTTQGGPVGSLTMNLLAAFAQFETEIRRERQMEGIAKAKGAGKYKGGPCLYSHNAGVDALFRFSQQSR